VRGITVLATSLSVRRGDDALHVVDCDIDALSVDTARIIDPGVQAAEVLDRLPADAPHIRFDADVSGSKRR
jgi:hypothetical protein